LVLCSGPHVSASAFVSSSFLIPIASPDLKVSLASLFLSLSLLRFQQRFRPGYSPWSSGTARSVLSSAWSCVFGGGVWWRGLLAELAEGAKFCGEAGGRGSSCMSRGGVRGGYAEATAPLIHVLLPKSISASHLDHHGRIDFTGVAAFDHWWVESTTGFASREFPRSGHLCPSSFVPYFSGRFPLQFLIQATRCACTMMIHRSVASRRSNIAFCC
ncbi:hypothetical protein BRADI_4g20566v3, partial [Brachypodium distachyon]